MSLKFNKITIFTLSKMQVLIFTLLYYIFALILYRLKQEQLYFLYMLLNNILIDKFVIIKI